MTDPRESTPAHGELTVDAGRLLDLALHMANRADDIVLGAFGGTVTHDRKADGSPVSRVDREVESILRDTIDREHPQAGILGEEYGAEEGAGRWVIDPIDGTQQFVSGDPRFAVLLAYEVDDEPIVGVVSAPAMGLRWWAGAGLGAHYSYRGAVARAKVSITRKMTRGFGMLLGGFHSHGWHDRGQALRISSRLERAGVRFSRQGVSWEAVRVSSGEFDLALTTGYRWDVAPLPVIVREAGGWAALTSSPGGMNYLAVSNGRLADGLAGALG